MSALSDFIAATNAIDDQDALIEAFKAFIASYGLDVASYHILAEHARPVGFEDGFIFHSFPEDWVEHYTTSGFFSVDPIIAAARSADAPFRWFDVDHKLPLDDAQKRYLHDLAASSVKEGYAVPIFGARGANAYFGLGSKAGRLGLSPIDIRVLQFACHQLHDRFVQIHGPVLQSPPPTLSGRETDVLRWMVMGKSNADIADIHGVSPHTVDTLVRRVFAKLGVTNRIAAALRGVGAGIVAA